MTDPVELAHMNDLEVIVKALREVGLKEFYELADKIEEVRLDRDNAEVAMMEEVEAVLQQP